ncbi:MAG: HEAT repeat domain-containing protein [Nitrospira sp.]|nr:HEAT repeat domain-containing protein [Nitrospira sp.]
MGSYFRLQFLFWLLLCSVVYGCYVDAPSGEPETVSRRLVELLADPDPDVRRTAAEALGKIGHKSSNSGLTVALDDPDAQVREAAALALGRLGDGKSGMALAGHLADSAEPVRMASAQALGEIEFSADREAQTLAVLRHPQGSARIAATRALLSLDAVSLSTDLINALRDPDARVRQGVAAALGETGNPGAVSYLRSLLETDMVASVRAEAAFRLGKIGDNGVLAELSRAAEADPDMRVRGWARWAVQQITLSHEFGSERQPSQ